MESGKEVACSNCSNECKSFANLSTDLLSVIFLRLPSESIMCCRCICKSWYLLTRDPFFIKVHMNMNGQGNRQELLVYENRKPDDVNFLLLNIDDKEIQHKIPLKDNLKDFEEMSNCNGLLCLSHKVDRDPVVIYNPITGESITLPPFQQDLLLIIDHTLTLCFDTVSATYKVIRTFEDCRRKRQYYMITVNREDTWKRLSPPRGVPGFTSFSSTYWNGDTFWTTAPDDHRMCKYCIMAFNPHGKSFQAITFPQVFHQSSFKILSLLHMGDSLALVEYEGSKFRLWKVSGEKIGKYFLVLEKEYDTCIDLGKYDSITHIELGRNAYYEVVGMLNEGGFLLQLSVIKMRRTYYFKFISGAIPPCEEVKISGMHSKYTAIVNYKSTLLSPKSI